MVGALLAVDEVMGSAAAAGRRTGGGGGGGEGGEGGEGGGDGAWLYLVLYRIRWCFLPIVVAGTITNCLNFFILSRKEMRSCSTSVYLSALAVADLGVMYFELFRVWFEWMPIIRQELYFTDVYCRAVNYMNGVVRDYSNWLIACLALERLIMVASPYCARTLCTTAKAKVVTLCLLLAICLPHVHALLFSRAQRNIGWVCWEDPLSTVGWISAAVVEVVVGYVVVIVVFVLNVILVLMIARNNRALPSASSSSSSSMASRHRRCSNKRLTRTLLLVAILFLVCETPRMISSVICKFVERTPFRRIVLNVSFVLSGVNHASNFFIYIVSSPRFRQLLAETLLRRRRRQGTLRPKPDDAPASASAAADGQGTLQGPSRRRRRRRTDDPAPRDIYVQIQLKVIVSAASETSH